MKYGSDLRQSPRSFHLLTTFPSGVIAGMMNLNINVGIPGGLISYKLFFLLYNIYNLNIENTQSSSNIFNIISQYWNKYSVIFNKIRNIVSSMTSCDVTLPPKCVVIANQAPARLYTLDSHWINIPSLALVNI